MGTKSEVLADPNSCLNKAADNEPLFILRAKDPVAADTINYWINIRRHYNKLHQQSPNEDKKLEQARIEAMKFEIWKHEMGIKS